MKPGIPIFLLFTFLLLNGICSPVTAGACGPTKGLFSGAILDDTIILPTGESSEKSPEESTAEEKSIQVTQNPQEWVSIGDQQVLRGMFQEAISSYDHALDVDPKNSDAWNGKMTSLLNLDRNDEVLEVFDEAEKEIPGDDGIWVNRGRAHYYSWDYLEAYTDADKALAINSNNIWALSLKAQSLANAGEYEEALKTADMVLDIDPDNTEVWYAKGIALKGLNQIEDAIDALNKEISFNPEMPCPYVDLYNVYLYSNQSDAAFEVIEKYLANIDPEMEDGAGQGARLLRDFMNKADWRSHSEQVKKDWEKIFSWVEKDTDELIKIYNDELWPYFRTKDFGNLTEEGEPVDIIDAARISLQLYFQDKYQDSHEGMADVALFSFIDGPFTLGLATDGTISAYDALSLAKQKLSYDPTDEMALILKENAQDFLNKSEKLPGQKPGQSADNGYSSSPFSDSSVSAGKKITKPAMTPDEYFAKASELYEQKDHSGSLQLMEEAVDLYPENAQMWAGQAAALNNLERYNEAIVSADKAISLNATLPHAWYVKGYALEKTGKLAESLIYYKKTVELDPTLTYAQESIDSVTKAL